MKFNDYQRVAKTYMITETIGHPLVYPALGLAGEAGEVVEKIKKVVRVAGKQLTYSEAEEIKKELGDVLWYLAAIADALSISLSEVASSNLDKLHSRYERNLLHGSGDNR